ncbi:MAG TPA: ACP S-malonyltransferase [Armatimonadota bacterium]|nr:ACP S-malonyltransferase [Armatimonadota bacterium]
MVTDADAAFIFPGQGSQRAGMGRDVCQTWEQAREVFDQVSRATGFDVAEACFEQSGRALESTAVAQPALLAVELACAAVLRRGGVRPAAVAGHSLGEFAAWVACEAIEQADAARLVALRARVMERAASDRPGAMAAILGLEAAQVEELCRQAARAGVVVPANFNAPGQVVISGEKEAVQLAARLAGERGAKTRWLAVAGGFHSPLMAPAAERFAAALGEVNASEPQVPVAANATGELVRTADEVRAAAAAQMTGAVRWESCVRRLLSLGLRRFYEVGPGNVLAGLVRRIEPAAEVVAAGDADSLRRIVG